MGFYKKSLGQHILQNIGAAKRIVDSLGVKKGDCVLEIGPGRGVLTGLLADTSAQLIAVEIDDRMADELREKFADRPNVRIHTEDILSFDFHTLHTNRKWKIIGNLPYNITSPVLEKLFVHHRLFSVAVFTVQREVADRMTSDVGSSHYSSLTVFVQSYCEAEKLLVLKPGSFFPAPKVDSAVVRLLLKEPPVLEAELLTAFHDFTQSLFGHRRKTILNCLSLSTSLERDVLAETVTGIGIEPNARPQNLAIQQLVSLFMATRSTAGG